jgi:hypothetical protein
MNTHNIIMLRFKQNRLMVQVLLLAFLMLPASAFAEAIGSVLMAKGLVTATAEDKTMRTLAKAASVFKGDVINTSVKSFAVIRMMDNTKLTLKPGTTIGIGNFDLTEGKEEGCINLVKGGLRAVTGIIGKRKPEAFMLDTPIASIGIRGTDFITRICDDDECLKDESQYFGEDYNPVPRPTLAERLNKELPSGLYNSCETGVITVSQCAGQVADFEMGKCRVAQQQDCSAVELTAGQAGYAGFNAGQLEGNGVLPLVPHFLKQDPHFKLSELSDEGLELIELFKDEFSTDDSCEVGT